MRCALAVLVLALAACTRVSTGGTEHGARNAWTIPHVLRVAARQDPDNLNMLLGTQTVDMDLDMLWAGFLFNFNDRDEMVPELATRVPTQQNGDISRDGLTVTYHLRRGVQWQDGAAFTADDVIFTYQQIMNPRNFIVSRAGYDRITRIDRVDDYTIAVHLKQPYAPFISTFFAPSAHSDEVLPKHLLARYPNINRIAYNELPIGTGPFRVTTYERGSRIVFTANPHYWRGRPKLERIEWYIVGSDNTMLSMLQSHQIDWFYRAPEALAAQLSNIPGTRVSLSPFTRYADLGINASVPALRDVRVRQALAYATDRTTLIHKVTHDVDMPGHTDQPPWLWSYNARAKDYPYDLRAAGALLDAAGWRISPDGIRRRNGEPLHVTLVSFTGSGTVNSAEVIVQAGWRQAGVDVTIKNYPSGQLYETAAMGGIEQAGKFDVIFENWANGHDPDDAILVMCDMAPPNGWNVYHICNAAIDNAERTAQAHYDQATRKAAFDVIQSIMQEQIPFFVLWYQRQFDVMNADVRGYRPARAVTPFWNAWEWDI